MKTLLITGIHGFVGKNLVIHFSHEYILYGLDLSIDSMPGVVDIFTWNSIAKIPNIDIVIHLAGKAHDLRNTSIEQEYFDVNLGLTKIIFNYFLSSKAKMFFFISSTKAVADQVTGTLTEDSISNPLTPYGRSKKEAENYILAQTIESDKYVYIFRPCMIHGPNNKGNLNLLYRMVSKGVPYPLGAFENNRSFLTIENLTFVFKNVIESEMPSGIYQIADDEPVSTNKLIEIIASSLNSKTRIIKVNPIFIRLIAKIGDYIKLPLNSERLIKLTESYIVSNEKIKRSLAITKMPISAENGLRRTMASFKQNK